VIPKVGSTADSSEELSELTDKESHEEVHDAAPPTLAAHTASLPRRFAAVKERLGVAETRMLDLCKQVDLAQDLSLTGAATGQTLFADSVMETVSPAFLGTVYAGRISLYCKLFLECERSVWYFVCILW
jgi:hypothetical protein